MPGIAPGVISSPAVEGRPEPGDYYREIYARGLAAARPRSSRLVVGARAAGVRGDGAAGRGLRVRRVPAPRTPCARTSRPSPLADRAADAARRRRARPRATSWDRDARAGAARADRRPDDRPSRGRAADARAAARASGSRSSSARRPPTARGDRRGGRDAPRWYQLYWPNDPEIAASMVRRAEAAGYGAIVVPSTPSSRAGSRATSHRRGCRSCEGVGNANFLHDPVFRAQLEQPPEEDLGAATGHYLGICVNPSLTWDDLAGCGTGPRCRSCVKGILHPTTPGGPASGARRGHRLEPRRPPGRRGDRLARRAAGDRRRRRRRTCGPARQRRPLRGRRGQGAGARGRAVLLGRPYLWGLALDGQAGVETVLRMLLAELDLTLALSGYTRPSELDRSALVRVSTSA